MESYLSIDVGSTATKAVLFDLEGKVLSSAERRPKIEQRAPGWVERDMEEVWSSTAGAVLACLERVSHPSIRAVSVTGHSDGLYPIDAGGSPTSRAIQATDTRAAHIAASFRGTRRGEQLAAITGTYPFAGSPASLCLWLLEHDPGRLAEARWLLFAKDWIRYRLTGTVGTDPTDAAASFLDIRTGRYSSEALDLYEVADLAEKLPPIAPSTAIAGEVTSEASAATSVPTGTPVVVGCHDVDAAAIGLGGTNVGDLSVVAGTFSINQLLVDEIHVNERWQVRNFVERNRWLAMSTSPTSASNLEWFASIVGRDGDFVALDRAVEEVLGDPSAISFLPYVFGAPDIPVSGSFVGLRSHHGVGHLTRAVYEGVALGHRLHLEWLEQSYSLPDIVLITGGASRSNIWMQMFAECLGRVVEAGDGYETSRGAAALAAVALEDADSVSGAASAMKRSPRSFHPRPDGNAESDRLYERFIDHRRLAAEFFGGDYEGSN